jgi:Flp pilus assembly protein TadB
VSEIPWVEPTWMGVAAAAVTLLLLVLKLVLGRSAEKKAHQEKRKAEDAAATRQEIEDARKQLEMNDSIQKQNEAMEDWKP